MVFLRGWDQFQTNETLFGVKSTFDEELYTTKLVKGPHMRELEKQALRLAREIEGEETRDLHLAEVSVNAFCLYFSFPLSNCVFTCVYLSIFSTGKRYAPVRRL